MNKSRSGFTIVELLIVIVVIAILAAISIVAYGGIQTRAENGKTVAAVNQAVKLLINYKTINGDYPGSGGTSCIGTGYVDDVCATHTDGSTPASANYPNLNTAFNSVGTLPAPSVKSFSMSNGQVVAGASWQYSIKMIRYHLNDASSTCDAGGARYVYGTAVQCRITLE